MPFPLLAAALPAAATAVGAYLGYRGQEDTNRANQQMAQSANAATAKMFYDNMNNQNWMATHAYQNAMQDMRLAGVNPMLAYSQGGASTGGSSGGSAQVGAPMKSPLSSGVNSAFETASTIANIRNTLAQNENIVSQAKLNQAHALKVVADTDLSKANLNKAKTFSNLWSLGARATSALDAHKSSSYSPLASFQDSLHEYIRGHHFNR